jgi:hypothetical protein
MGMACEMHVPSEFFRSKYRKHVHCSSECPMVANVYRHLQFSNGSEHLCWGLKKDHSAARWGTPEEHPFSRKGWQQDIASVCWWYWRNICEADGVTSQQPQGLRPPACGQPGTRLRLFATPKLNKPRPAPKLVSTVECHEEREERREVFPGLLAVPWTMA